MQLRKVQNDTEFCKNIRKEKENLITNRRNKQGMHTHPTQNQYMPTSLPPFFYNRQEDNESTPGSIPWATHHKSHPLISPTKTDTRTRAISSGAAAVR
jgi:hypothetical protein